MRTIKFRGKTLNKKWVCGDLLHYTNRFESSEKKNGCIIVTDYESKSDNSFKIVIPETVGQFTGLHDKNGKEIFEGDIVKITERGGYCLKYAGVVVYCNETCDFVIDISAMELYSSRKSFKCGKQSINDGYCTIEWYEECEVLGNIHDNPDLLTNRE